MVPISKFPGGYRLIHHIRDKRIALVGGARLSYVRMVIRNEDFTTIRLPLESIEYWLALKGFFVYTPPKKSQSSGSNALYLARSADKKEGLLLQLLPPFSKTSCHHHTQKREAFHLIEGVATLITSQSVWTLYRGDTHVVEPGVIHQTRTDARPAIILIEVVGDPEGLSMQDHVYD